MHLPFLMMRRLPKKSIKFFVAQGVAVMKIFMQNDSNEAAFENLVRNFSVAEQTTFLQIASAEAPFVYDDNNIDEPAFRKGWES